MQGLAKPIFYIDILKEKYLGTPILQQGLSLPLRLKIQEKEAKLKYSYGILQARKNSNLSHVRIFYHSITSHYRNATGALLVYDVTKYKSFSNLKNWYQELLKSTDDKLQILLIGNKIDLLHKQPNNRQVFEHEAKKYAKDNNMIFYEVSAFLGDNVNESFQVLLNGSLYYQLLQKYTSLRTKQEPLCCWTNTITIIPTACI